MSPILICCLRVFAGLSAIIVMIATFIEMRLHVNSLIEYRGTSEMILRQQVIEATITGFIVPAVLFVGIAVAIYIVTKAFDDRDDT